MVHNVKKSNGFFFYIFAVICIFCYIYQFNLEFLELPVINSSVQVSWALMFLYAVFVSLSNKKIINFKGLKTYDRWKKHVVCFIVLFVYSLLLLVVVGWGKGTNISLEIIKIFIYGILMFWIWSVMFDSIDTFLNVLLIASVIQTVIIIYCLIDPSFAFVLDQTVNLDPNSSEHETSILREGYAGGVGCISSYGLIRYTLTGLFPCTYFCVNRKGVFYLVLFVVMAFCASMIARTGLLFDAILAIYIIIKRLRSSSKVSIVSLIFVAIIGITAIRTIFYSSQYNDFVEERFYRYESLMDDKGSVFFDSYFHGTKTKYPPINSETILGVGVTSGTSANGYKVNVDGGPMRQYSAIGIIGCILFYLFVMRNQAKTISLLRIKNNQHLLWLLFLCLFISEWKETTYMALWPLMLFFFVGYLLQVEENRIIINA